MYADPALEFDHRLRCAGVALLLPPGTAVAGHSAAAWQVVRLSAPDLRDLDGVVARVRAALVR